jgi:hypothetical protein
MEHVNAADLFDSNCNDGQALDRAAARREAESLIVVPSAELRGVVRTAWRFAKQHGRCVARSLRKNKKKTLKKVNSQQTLSTFPKNTVH